MEITITLTAGQSSMQKTSGKYLNIKQCTLPLSAAFNGGPGQNVSAGQTYDKTHMNNGEGFSYFSLTNNNSTTVTVTFSASNSPANSQPVDNSVSNAAHYDYGNLGIAISGNGNVANQSGGVTSVNCDANGYLQIPNTPNLLVSGKNNGHRRQTVFFSVSSSSPASLNVLDLSGYCMMVLAPGDKIVRQTDSDFYVSGAGGTAWVSIGQEFLSQ